MASYLDALRLGTVNRQTIFVAGLVMLVIAVMGRTYPIGFVDVDVGRWTELAGEADSAGK